MNQGRQKMRREGSVIASCISFVRVTVLFYSKGGHVNENENVFQRRIPFLGDLHDCELPCKMTYISSERTTLVEENAWNFFD